jgi:hypothetical protein
MTTTLIFLTKDICYSMLNIKAASLLLKMDDSKRQPAPSAIISRLRVTALSKFTELLYKPLRMKVCRWKAVGRRAEHPEKTGFVCLV